MIVSNVNKYVMDCLRLRGYFIVSAPFVEGIISIPIARILSISNDYIVIYNGDKLYVNNGTEFLIFKICKIDKYCNVFVVSVPFDEKILEYVKFRVDEEESYYIDCSLEIAIKNAIEQRELDARDQVGPIKVSSLSRFPDTVIESMNVMEPEFNTFEDPYNLEQKTDMDESYLATHYDNLGTISQNFNRILHSVPEGHTFIAATQTELDENKNIIDVDHSKPSYIAGNTYYPAILKQVVDVVPPEQRNLHSSQNNASSYPYIIIPSEKVQSTNNPIGYSIPIDEEEIEVTTPHIKTKYRKK